VSEATRSLERIGISVVAENQPGVLHELTGAIAARFGNILSVESLESLTSLESRLYFEIEVPGAESLLADTGWLPEPLRTPGQAEVDDQSTCEPTVEQTAGNDGATAMG